MRRGEGLQGRAGSQTCAGQRRGGRAGKRTRRGVRGCEFVCEGVSRRRDGWRAGGVTHGRLQHQRRCKSRWMGIPHSSRAKRWPRRQERGPPPRRLASNAPMRAGVSKPSSAQHKHHDKQNGFKQKDAAVWQGGPFRPQPTQPLALLCLNPPRLYIALHARPLSPSTLPSLRPRTAHQHELLLLPSPNTRYVASSPSCLLAKYKIHLLLFLFEGPATGLRLPDSCTPSHKHTWHLSLNSIHVPLPTKGTAFPPPQALTRPARPPHALVTSNSNPATKHPQDARLPRLPLGRGLCRHRPD